ncbi:MAG: hypothetical protein M9962_04450 [Oligoflexia bacterium]|nr:hypothetical protein [Oligoflexia bacterium]
MKKQKKLINDNVYVDLLDYDVLSRELDKISKEADLRRKQKDNIFIRR